MASQVEWVKWIPGARFLVDGFRFPSPNCAAYFLTHAHSDHTTGLNSSWSAGGWVGAGGWVAGWVGMWGRGGEQVPSDDWWTGCAGQSREGCRGALVCGRCVVRSEPTPPAVCPAGLSAAVQPPLVPVPATPSPRILVRDFVHPHLWSAMRIRPCLQAPSTAPPSPPACCVLSWAYALTAYVCCRWTRRPQSAG